MDSVAFAKCFETFAETVRDRFLLLLFGDHLTHITVPFITRTLEDNGKKCPHTFVARLQKRFRGDSDGPIKAIGCVWLKEKLGFSDTVLEEEVSPRSEIIVVSDIKIGTIKCEMAGRQKWNVANYWIIKKSIEAASKFDRVSCKNHYICDN